MPTRDTDQYSDAEAAKRMEKAIRKALNTPRVSHAKATKKRPVKSLSAAKRKSV